MASRTLAIGDIHGCLAAFDALLALLAPTGADTVVVLGDCVDRGPDSRGVIARVRELATSTTVIPILGNHEEMMLAAAGRDSGDLEWLDCGGASTLASYGLHDPAKLPAADLDFIRTWRDWYETDDYFFAHGNYEASLPLADQLWHELRWRPLRWHLPGWHVSGKRAVLGHSAQKNGEVLDLDQLLCIDTYCHGGGWLTAFCAETGQIWQVNSQGQRRP